MTATVEILISSIVEATGSTAPIRKQDRGYTEPFGIVTDIYPLVMADIAIENDHRNSGFSHESWWIFP